MALADVRDIAVIILAIESIVVGVLLILLLWQLRSLTRLLQDEIRPMLDSMQETIGTVKGTTSLVSDTIVSPAVKIGGFVAGLRRALEVMLTIKRQHKSQ
jgi:ABC-type nitrate/sulfonate/bicarbonate transport system permease component